MTREAVATGVAYLGDFISVCGEPSGKCNTLD